MEASVNNKKVFMPNLKYWMAPFLLKYYKIFFSCTRKYNPLEMGSHFKGIVDVFTDLKNLNFVGIYLNANVLILNQNVIGINIIVERLNLYMDFERKLLKATRMGVNASRMIINAYRRNTNTQERMSIVLIRMLA